MIQRHSYPALSSRIIPRHKASSRPIPIRRGTRCHGPKSPLRWESFPGAAQIVALVPPRARSLRLRGSSRRSLPWHPVSLDYRGHTMTTIGEEKRYNPRIARKSREEFIEIMANLRLPPPKRIQEAVPANRACGDTPA
jgi:hypothetical protein